MYKKIRKNIIHIYSLISRNCNYVCLIKHFRLLLFFSITCTHFFYPFQTLLNSKMTDIKSEKGRKKLLHDGFLYVFDQMSGDMERKFWRCEKFGAKDKCKARLHTDLHDNVLKTLNEHICDQGAAHIEAERLKTAVKRRAEETMETPAVLRAQIIEKVPTPVLAELPNKSAMRKIIERTRDQENRPPPAPNCLATLHIPDNFRRYMRSDNVEEQFLLADSGVYSEGQRQERILLFGRMSFGNWAAQMDHVYVDGTFNIAPPMFSQVFVVLSRRGDWVFPVLYALLTSKSKEIYTRLFRSIKEVWPEFNPQSASMDYEAAIIGAIKDVFPGIELHGCFFHFVRNLQRRLASEGLWQRYKNDALFAEQAKMITSMAFLPISDLTPAIAALERELPNELQPILEWFIFNYVGRPRFDGTRNPALFDPSIWNVNHRTLQGRDRTNNYSEAANRRLHGAFGCDHPTIWRFIEKLRCVQKGTDADFAQFITGAEPPRKRVKYRNADNRILTILQRYVPFNNIQAQQRLPALIDHQYQPNYNLIIEFLKGISNNYNINP